MKTTIFEVFAANGDRITFFYSMVAMIEWLRITNPDNANGWRYRETDAGDLYRCDRCDSRDRYECFGSCPGPSRYGIVAGDQAQIDRETGTD